MEPQRSVGALPALAWTNALVHGLGLAAAFFWLRPGTPLLPLSERRDYLATAPPGWSLGWLVWMLCAIALASFLLFLEMGLPRPRLLSRFALALAAVGSGIDLLCDYLFIDLLPELAGDGSVPEWVFLKVERTLGTMGTVGANGFYSLAVLLFTLHLPRRRAPRFLGYATFACGMVMAGGGLLGNPWLVAAATGPTIACFSAWTIVTARLLALAKSAAV